MSSISREDMIKFADELEQRASALFSDARVELKRFHTGHYIIIMHTDDTLQCESECYMIDPISKEWIKTYGTF